MDNGQEKVRGLKSEGGGGNEMGGDEPGVMWDAWIVELWEEGIG